MKIKGIIKKFLPKSYVYGRKYRLCEKNANKTYREAEKELNEKFKIIFGREIDWENPKTYNEKINVAKVYDPTPIKTKLTDKILVTDWVKKKLKDDGCKFIPLLGTYDSVDEINFNDLPSCFVIKMNDDSGSVYLCDEDHPINKDILKKYKYYLQKRNYAYSSYEMQYKDIKPKIMIEQCMGRAIRDYKFQCFNGRCCSCRVDFDRFGKHTRNFYDRSWKLLPYNKGDLKNNPGVIEKPKNLKKMWKMAEKLSSDFDQVRVDFYDIDNVIYFGEMTFTNGAGFEEFHPAEVDLEMGKLWKLDMESISKHRHQLLNSGAIIGD